VSAGRLTTALLALCACLCVPASAAAAEDYRYENVAADVAAASRAVLRLGDLGSASAWQPVSERPSGSRIPRRQPSCPAPRPKLSDLVVTGDAISQFKLIGGAVWIASTAQVFRTRPMLEASWRRELEGSYALACGRAALEREFGRVGRVTSFERIAFPRVGSHTRAFRGLIRAGRVSLAIDLIVFARGRMVSTLMMGGVIDSPRWASALRSAEQRLVAIMLARGSTAI
jgi:hypothetical protein